MSFPLPPEVGSRQGPAARLEAGLDLTAHNTLALPSRARHGARVSSVGELGDVAAAARSLRLPLRVIGSGSNLVLREAVDAVVAVIETKGRKITGECGDTVFVSAEAGEDWSAFCSWTLSHSLWGLENLSGIPGTVGAAPVQNIGAYGVELSDRLHSLVAYDIAERTLRTFPRADCRFGYRHSRFKDEPGRWIIVQATFALARSGRPVLRYPGLQDLAGDAGPSEVAERVLMLRREKLPDWRILPNAGSFFHNPVVPAELAERIVGGPRHEQPGGRVKLSAAWLIEACGLKGFRIGQAGIYEHHALIVVNHGGATYGDISRLAASVATAVRERFGVQLVQEPSEF